MGNEVYGNLIIIFNVIMLTSFIFYTIIAKFMLKVNDLFSIQNKKSIVSILSFPIFISILLCSSLIILEFKLEYNKILFLLNIAAFGLFLAISNLIYLIVSFTYNTKKELEVLGIKNKKIYEDIYCYKLTIIYLISLVLSLYFQNKMIFNYLMVCMYILIFGYYKTYNFLGNMKFVYIDTFIANNIKKDLKILKK